MYEVMESIPIVNVQVVKNGSNDITVSVLLNIIGGTALGKYIGREINNTIHSLKCVYVLHISQLVMTTHF